MYPVASNDYKLVHALSAEHAAAEINLLSVMQSVLAALYPTVNPRKVATSTEQAADTQPTTCDMDMDMTQGLYRAFAAVRAPGPIRVVNSLSLLLRTLVCASQQKGYGHVADK